YLNTITRAMEVIKWFNNHGTALSLFQKEQKNTHPERSILALILPCATRWTNHYVAMDRLLAVSGSLRACCLKHSEALQICAGKTADVIWKPTPL
ncbi:hypothetical protein FA95DRAFT_1502894, partial [Auriscalpium vulgare]